MKFNQKEYELIIGKFSGYVLMFLIFSIILYLVLSFFNKIPSFWSYPHIFFIALSLVLLGKGIKLWLEQ